MLHALIMAGGGGTRFWPRSRAAKPKQFLALGGQHTLLQQACDRLEAQVPPANTWIITSTRHRGEAQRQSPRLPADHIIGEPMGRDTAPCIGLGAALIARSDPGAVMIVTPADHVIEPASEFQRAARAAEEAVAAHPDALVTFGIPPIYPAVSYGYIRRGAEVGRFGDTKVFRVERFREKPDAELAEQYFAEGGYLWNAGIFVWRAAAVLNELKRNKPALAEGIARIADAWDTPKRDAILAEVYPTLERISIDYAVMEPAKTAMVLEAPYRWDDVGSWLALERMQPPDAAGNTVAAMHAGVNTHGCVIVGDAGRLIATVSVRDLIIVQDGDALLVADRKDEAGLKQLVEKLGKEGLEKFL
ncbi:MAG: mannose-1-phosphate guanylyltransferase [Gemmataceae bacterium]